MFLDQKNRWTSDPMGKGVISVQNGNVAVNETLIVFGEILESFSTIGTNISALLRTNEHQAALAIDQVSKQVSDILVVAGGHKS